MTVLRNGAGARLGLRGHPRNWPAHGWLGLGLVIIFWIANWSLSGLRTHWGFFPLWLGYCLTVDGLVYARKGNSLLTRNPRAYLGLFLVSAPCWWLFELINLRTQNWYYEGRQFFTDFQFLVLGSVSFSTVMPAVFGTGELVSTLNWIKRVGRGPVTRPTPVALVALFSTGCVMLALPLFWPRRFFPLVWISLYLMLEPLNVWLGNRSLIQYTATGDWRPVLSLWIGCLICGFFWELWNAYSYPKWVYRVPFVDFARIFEMPLLGYFGHIPFSLELFALYHLILGVFKPHEFRDVIRVLPHDSTWVPGSRGEALAAEGVCAAHLWDDQGNSC